MEWIEITAYVISLLNTAVVQPRDRKEVSVADGQPKRRKTDLGERSL